MKDILSDLPSDRRAVAIEIQSIGIVSANILTANKVSFFHEEIKIHKMADSFLSPHSDVSKFILGVMCA